MELSVDDGTTWWILKAGRDGVLEDDWLDRDIVTTGWGDGAGDFRDVSPEEFRSGDPDAQYQPSKFVGYDENGMEEGDTVIVYAPGKGNISGIGTVGEVDFDENLGWDYLSQEGAEEAKVDDHYYWRPVTWFDLGTPVRVPDLSTRFQVQGEDQIPTPPTLNRYGTLADDRDRIESLVDEVKQSETVDTTTGGFGPEQESQIQDWVVANVRELGLRNARKEVNTTTGRVDVLAESDDAEAVIEIKHGRAGDRALGQLLGYVGARSDEASTPVEGILIAESFTRGVRKAGEVLDNVQLVEFEVSTQLHPV